MFKTVFRHQSPANIPTLCPERHFFFYYSSYFTVGAECASWLCIKAALGAQTIKQRHSLVTVAVSLWASCNWWFLPLQLCVHLSVLSSCCNLSFPLCCLRLSVCFCPYSHAANQPIDLIEELEDEREAWWDGKSVERLMSDACRASALFCYLVRTFAFVCTTRDECHGARARSARGLLSLFVRDRTGARPRRCFSAPPAVVSSSQLASPGCPPSSPSGFCLDSHRSARASCSPLLPLAGGLRTHRQTDCVRNRKNKWLCEMLNVRLGIYISEII